MECRQRLDRLCSLSLSLIFCAILGIRSLFHRDANLAWIVLLTLVYFTVISAGPR